MAIWRQSGTVWIGAMAAAGLALATQIVLARNFDSGTFGALSNGYSLSILIATFAFHGVSEVMLRRTAPVGVAAGIRAACLLLVAGLLTAIAWTILSGEVDRDPALLCSFIPFVIIQGGITGGMLAFQIERSSTGIAAWPGGFQAVRLGVALVVLSLGASAIWIPLGWSIALIPMAWIGLSRLQATGRWKNDASSMPGLRLVRHSFPFSATRLLEFAELQLPIVLAMPLLGASDTGRLAACLAIIQGLLLLPISVFQRLLRPRFHDWSETDPVRLRSFGLGGAAVMLIAGLLLGQALRPFSASLLSTIFGEDFSTYAGFLEQMTMLVPIWFASIAVNATLVSTRMADLRLACQFVGITILVVITLLSGDDRSSATEGLLRGMFASQVFLLISGVVLLLKARSTSSRT